MLIKGLDCCTMEYTDTPCSSLSPLLFITVCEHCVEQWFFFPPHGTVETPTGKRKKREIGRIQFHTLVMDFSRDLGTCIFKPLSLEWMGMVVEYIQHETVGTQFRSEATVFGKLPAACMYEIKHEFWEINSEAVLTFYSWVFTSSPPPSVSWAWSQPGIFTVGWNLLTAPFYLLSSSGESRHIPNGTADKLTLNNELLRPSCAPPK